MATEPYLPGFRSGFLLSRSPQIGTGFRGDNILLSPAGFTLMEIDPEAIKDALLDSGRSSYYTKKSVSDKDREIQH
jgi:hypothetical protein